MGLFSRKKQEEVIVPDEDYFKPVEEIEVESLPVGKMPNTYMESVDTLSNEVGLDNNVNYANVEKVDTPSILFDDDIVDAPSPVLEPKQDISSIIGFEPTYQQPNYIQQPVEQPMNNFQQEPVIQQQVEPQPMMQEPQNNIFGAPVERRFIGEIKSEEPIYRKKEEVSPIHGNISIFNTQQIPVSDYDNQVGGRTR